MEELIKALIEQQKETNRLTREQNELLAKLVAVSSPSGKDYLINNLLDNTDIKQIFKIGDTKFFSLKKLLEHYRPDGKDYYFADEVIQTIKKYRRGSAQ